MDIVGKNNSSGTFSNDVVNVSDFLILDRFGRSVNTLFFPLLSFRFSGRQLLQVCGSSVVSGSVDFTAFISSALHTVFNAETSELLDVSIMRSIYASELFGSVVGNVSAGSYVLYQAIPYSSYFDNLRYSVIQSRELLEYSGGFVSAYDSAVHLSGLECSNIGKVKIQIPKDNGGYYSEGSDFSVSLSGGVVSITVLSSGNMSDNTAYRVLFNLNSDLLKVKHIPFFSGSEFGVSNNRFLLEV